VQPFENRSEARKHDYGLHQRIRISVGRLRDLVTDNSRQLTNKWNQTYSSRFLAEEDLLNKAPSYLTSPYNCTLDPDLVKIISTNRMRVTQILD